MVTLVALSPACHVIMQQPDKMWRYLFLFLLIVLQAERAITNTVFTPSINPTRGVIIQPRVAFVQCRCVLRMVVLIPCFLQQRLHCRDTSKLSAPRSLPPSWEINDHNKTLESKLL